LQADLNVFYSDYSKYVVEGFFPALNRYYEANAGTARIKGVSADINWRLTADWVFRVNSELVDARFVSIDASNTGYEVGDRVPLTTKYSGSVSIEHGFRWQDKAGSAVLYFSEMSGVQERVSGGYVYSLAQSDVLRFLNFTAGLNLYRDLRVGMFARNLLDERGYLDPFWIYGQGSRPRPRTFGVDFKVDLAD
jgi:outer membrane receptor protein involved in Fe transport